MKTMETTMNFKSIEFDGKSIICEMEDKSCLVFSPECGSIRASIYVSLYDPSDYVNQEPVLSAMAYNLHSDVINREQIDPICETLEFKAMTAYTKAKKFDSAIKEHITRSFNIITPQCKLKKSDLKLITKFFYAYYYKKIYRKNHFDVIDMIIENFRKSKEISKEFIFFLNEAEKVNKEMREINNQ